MPRLLTNVRSNIVYIYGVAVLFPLLLSMLLPVTHIVVRGSCLFGGIVLLTCVYLTHPAPRLAALGNLIGASLLIATLLTTIIALVNNGAALG